MLNLYNQWGRFVQQAVAQFADYYFIHVETINFNVN